MKRAILIVLDSVGVGAMPDANLYGDDPSANTLLNSARKTDGFSIPNLYSMGIADIDGLEELKQLLESNSQVSHNNQRIGSYGRIAELSKGKDTITGHYELMGIETEKPFKTYPDGFPEEFMHKFESAIGIECIGNYPASGTAIIDELGEEHEKTGKPIVYTSADSVFQIAANIDIISVERLYEICEVAREMLVGEFTCARVIARPYTLENSERNRTSQRKDYAISPPKDSILDIIKNSGKAVYAVGKINDIYNGQGISKYVKTKSNADGVDKTLEAIEKEFEGLIFSNLVDFDSLYGHRRDPNGYGLSLMEFDKRLPEILNALKNDDILLLCADHGNDPTQPGTDHTREYIPLLVYGKNIKANVNLSTRSSFADIGATIYEYLGVPNTAIGDSFLSLIMS